MKGIDGIMKRFGLIIVCGFFCTVLIYVNDLFALGGGGFRNEVVDAEASGRGYCFTAQADGPSAVHYNPAGLIQLEGSYVSLGYTLEAPRNECESDVTGDTVQMQKQIFLIPNFYYVSDFSSENFRFGIAALSSYGLSTDWASDTFSRHVSEETDLEIYNVNPAVAYSVNDSISIAAGINYANSHISKHKVLTSIFSDNSGDFHLKGSDEGWGYNIGLLIRSSDRERIGFSYRSAIDLKYKGTVTLANLNPTYAGVFGSSTYTTAMESKLTIPRSLAAGYAYQLNDKWVVETDVEWTDWSCIEEDFVTYPREGDSTRLQLLNTGNPVSKDWNDAIAYGIGAEYKATDKLDLRCGFSYHESAVPSVNFDTALPDANKHAVTLGMGYLFKDVKLDASYAFFKLRDVDINNDVGATVSSDIDGKYKGYVNLFAISFTRRY